MAASAAQSAGWGFLWRQQGALAVHAVEGQVWEGPVSGSRLMVRPTDRVVLGKGAGVVSTTDKDSVWP